MAASDTRDIPMKQYSDRRSFGQLSLELAKTALANGTRFAEAHRMNKVRVSERKPRCIE
jgi:hypothetical protein